MEMRQTTIIWYVSKTTQFKIEVKYLDASDALATALCCYYFLQNPLPTKSGKNGWASL